MSVSMHWIAFPLNFGWNTVTTAALEKKTVRRTGLGMLQPIL